MYATIKEFIGEKTSESYTCKRRDEKYSSTKIND